MEDKAVTMMTWKQIENLSLDELKHEADVLDYDFDETILRIDGLIDGLKNQTEQRSEGMMFEKLKLYEIAHREIMDRLKIRGISIAAYLIGAFFVFLFVSHLNGIQKEILLAIPFFSLACSFMFSHHNLMIGARLSYCKSDLKMEGLTIFENSAAYTETVATALESVTISYLVATTVPAVIALFLYIYPYSISEIQEFSSGQWFLIVFSLICFVSSQRIIFRSYELRTKTKLFRRTNVNYTPGRFLRYLGRLLFLERYITQDLKLLNY